MVVRVRCNDNRALLLCYERPKFAKTIFDFWAPYNIARNDHEPSGEKENFEHPVGGQPHGVKCDIDEGLKRLFKVLAALSICPVVAHRSNTRRDNNVGL